MLNLEKLTSWISLKKLQKTIYSHLKIISVKLSSRNPKKMFLVFVLCLLWSYVSQYFVYCFILPVWKEKEKMSLYRHKCRAFSRPSTLYSHTTVTNECQCTCEPRELSTNCSLWLSCNTIRSTIPGPKKAQYISSVLWMSSRITLQSSTHWA